MLSKGAEVRAVEPPIGRLDSKVVINDLLWFTFWLLIPKYLQSPIPKTNIPIACQDLNTRWMFEIPAKKFLNKYIEHKFSRIGFVPPPTYIYCNFSVFTDLYTCVEFLSASSSMKGIMLKKQRSHCTDLRAPSITFSHCHKLSKCLWL